MTTTLRRTRLPLAAAALLAVGAPLSAQETVTLRFNWGEGQARVTSETEVTMTADMMDNSTTASLGYTISVQEHPDGYVVRHSDYDFGDGLGMEALAELGPGSSQRIAEVAQSMQDIAADMIVSPDGEYLRMADDNSIEELMSTIADLMEEVFAETGMAGMEDVRGQFMDREAWGRSAEFGWERMIGQWVGDWVIGEARTVTTNFPLPIGDTQLEMTQELTVEGRTSCGPRGGECFVLLARSASDEAFVDMMREMIEETMAEMGAGGMAPEIIDLDMSVESRMLVEVGTLRPISSSSTTSIWQVLAMMGNEMAMDQSQSESTTWDWGN